MITIFLVPFAHYLVQLNSSESDPLKFTSKKITPILGEFLWNIFLARFYHHKLMKNNHWIPIDSRVPSKPYK